MKKLFLLSISFLCLFSCFSQASEKAAVRKVLTTQEAAWNAGNIDDFMKGYWQNDSLMFIGKTGITYGWQSTLEHYKKGYPDTAAMGKLAFTLLEVKPLSASYFFVVGRWHLNRSAGNIGGHFSLLLKKIKEHWLIIADHTS